jgi:putative protease
MNKPELLAPSGSFEKMKVALLYGADAVYLGGSEFGLRAASKNFNMDELSKAVEYAHKSGKKVHVTVNAIIRNEQITRLKEYLRLLNQIRPDALIIVDLGALSLAREYAPDIELHISTQANNTNYLSIAQWHKLGAKRIVLSRELTLKEIKEIRRNISPEIELEAFVHGAMCISYSGRCHLSNYMASRDANMGACAQSCRWKYFLVEEQRPDEYLPVFENDSGAFILNSKDLNMIEHIPELIDAGICSFKIEGRVKSEYYVATITNAYRQAIDAYCAHPETYEFQRRWLDEVHKVSHRQYGTGFFFGNPKQSGQAYESSVYIREYDVVAVVEENCTSDGFALCTQRNHFRVGEELELLSPGRESEPFVLQEMYDQHGNRINSAPHAVMPLRIKFPFAAQKGDMLRKAK